MNIDPSNLPAELWAIDRYRVRAGKGPRRVVPVKTTQWAGGGVAGVVAKGGGFYLPECLHATEDEAKTAGRAIAAVEYAHALGQWQQLAERLRVAHKECGGEE
jgi:hypothetical protein